MLRTTIVLAALGPTIALGPAPIESIHLVACAPGYPGSTEQAQPTMDVFAGLLAEAAEWDRGSITAEYQESEEGGVARLRDPSTQLALMPLAMFFKYEDELDLAPLAQTVGPDNEGNEVWSLVAATERIDSPANLAGWTILGVPGYAEPFVRGNILGAWGSLPDDASIEFSRRVLGGLRRAGGGDDVAVILDGAQTAALASLPNGTDFEVVASSAPMPMGLVVSVGDRVADDVRAALAAALLRVHGDDEFEAALATVRVERFGALDQDMLEAGRAAYAAAR